MGLFRFSFVDERGHSIFMLKRSAMAHEVGPTSDVDRGQVIDDSDRHAVNARSTG